MKKLMTLTALAMIMGAPAAFAGHHEGGEGKHEGKHRGAMFDKHDLNGDGMISKAEFMGSQEEKFHEIDTNNDGSLSKEEIAVKAKAMHEKMKEHREKRKQMREEKADSAE